MKLLKSFPMLFICGLLVVGTSCKKEEEEEEEKVDEVTTATAESPTPSFATGSGALIAIKSKSTTQSPGGAIETNIGLGVAVFYNNGNSGSFLDAGAVKANTKTFTKQANNSYVFQPSVIDATGIDFGTSVDWTVGGASAVTAFSHTTAIGFPNITKITSGETVTKGNGYTLTASGISGADSVIFQIGSVVKTLAGDATSYTFTSGELSGEANGTSIAQVAAYKIEEKDYNSKTYFFVNETVVTQTVTIN